MPTINQLASKRIRLEKKKKQKAVNYKKIHLKREFV
jgi:hypothetical protein